MLKKKRLKVNTVELQSPESRYWLEFTCFLSNTLNCRRLWSWLEGTVKYWIMTYQLHKVILCWLYFFFLPFWGKITASCAKFIKGPVVLWTSQPTFSQISNLPPKKDWIFDFWCSRSVKRNVLFIPHAKREMTNMNMNTSKLKLYHSELFVTYILSLPFHLCCSYCLILM